ncbi:MAG: uncharacterized protein JWP25_8592 [Bradyrhizobium sp.]|jgi:uncharacterized protein (DUF302 family)|nr:uncharacterized protein [Bradyrhizobium sp.]
MQSTQTVGIDLPLKALVWQDASGETWLSYNDPEWIAKRHGLHQAVEAPLKAMSDALCMGSRARQPSLRQRCDFFGRRGF